jgi:hypothetical protein
MSLPFSTLANVLLRFRRHTYRKYERVRAAKLLAQVSIQVDLANLKTPDALRRVVTRKTAGMYVVTEKMSPRPCCYIISACGAFHYCANRLSTPLIPLLLLSLCPFLTLLHHLTQQHLRGCWRGSRWVSGLLSSSKRADMFHLVFNVARSSAGGPRRRAPSVFILRSSASLLPTHARRRRRRLRRRRRRRRRRCPYGRLAAWPPRSSAPPAR